MESLARDFLTRNRGVFQLNPAELVLDPAGAASIGNSIYFLRFQWTRGGVKISDNNCGPISLASTGTGLIDFGAGAGTDCTTPGFGGAGNTHAAQTSTGTSPGSR